jgi:hypothetical protein
MRDDMFKVIVERPRRIHSNAYKGDGRAFRNREDGPSRLGMNKGYDDRKGLNENLAPLKRFLERQVNRPWDKVTKKSVRPSLYAIRKRRLSSREIQEYQLNAAQEKTRMGNAVQLGGTNFHRCISATPSRRPRHSRERGNPGYSVWR